MNLYEKATNVASEILANGLLGDCALRQTNPKRGGALNLLHESLQTSLDEAQKEPGRPHGFGETRLLKTIRLVEAVRYIVNFGVFKDFRKPPYVLPETPERRTKVRLIEARAADLLQVADALSAPDTRTPLEKIRDHVHEAEAIWGQLDRQEQDD